MTSSNAIIMMKTRLTIRATVLQDAYYDLIRAMETLDFLHDAELDLRDEVVACQGATLALLQGLHPFKPDAAVMMTRAANGDDPVNLRAECRYDAERVAHTLTRHGL